MRWDEFAAECPELAAAARERLERDQVILLGTLQADGSPRVSAVECDFVDGELMSGMIWESSKALDLLRDERVMIHSLVPDKAHESDSQGDLKLSGRAVLVTDPRAKRRYEETMQARIDWRPPEPYHCFAFDIERAGMVRFADDGRHVWGWRAGGRLRKRVLRT